MSYLDTTMKMICGCYFMFVFAPYMKIDIANFNSIVQRRMYCDLIKFRIYSMGKIRSNEEDQLKILLSQ